MGRARRVDVGGMVYYALNRANFRSRLFRATAHDADFLGIVEENLNSVPMRPLAYGLMPNHGHLVLYPRADSDLSKFLRRLTLTHTQRYQAKERLIVGFGEMGVEGGGAIRPGKRDAESRAPEKRFLTPFSP
jgi:putative transposase